jgi:hypothetical protein
MGIFKRLAFMAIGCAVGGLVEGGLTVADERHTKKKLGLPMDATEEELRDAINESKMQTDSTPELQAILEGLDNES